MRFYAQVLGACLFYAISGCEFCEHRAIIEILANSYLMIVKNQCAKNSHNFIYIFNLLSKQKDAQRYVTIKLQGVSISIN